MMPAGINCRFCRTELEEERGLSEPDIRTLVNGTRRRGNDMDRVSVHIKLPFKVDDGGSRSSL
jgi:hypothetical protein